MSEFHKSFTELNRQDHFSHEGLNQLYDFISRVDEGYELNVVSLCCDFIEADQYQTVINYDLDNIKELRDHTMVVWQDDKKNTVMYLAY